MHTIEIEISEVDRQTAEGYCNIRTCLVATNLLNRGYNVRWAGIDYAVLDTGIYNFNDEFEITCRVLRVKHFQSTKPFYRRGVVGLKFSMTCQSYTPPKTEDVQKPSQHPQPVAADTSGELALTNG